MRTQSENENISSFLVRPIAFLYLCYVGASLNRSGLYFGLSDSPWSVILFRTCPASRRFR